MWTDIDAELSVPSGWIKQPANRSFWHPSDHDLGGRSRQRAGERVSAQHRFGVVGDDAVQQRTARPSGPLGLTSAETDDG